MKSKFFESIRHVLILICLLIPMSSFALVQKQIVRTLPIIHLAYDNISVPNVVSNRTYSLGQMAIDDIKTIEFKVPSKAGVLNVSLLGTSPANLLSFSSSATLIGRSRYYRVFLKYRPSSEGSVNAQFQVKWTNSTMTGRTRVTYIYQNSIPFNVNVVTVSSDRNNILSIGGQRYSIRSTFTNPYFQHDLVFEKEINGAWSEIPNARSYLNSIGLGTQHRLPKMTYLNSKIYLMWLHQDQYQSGAQFNLQAATYDLITQQFSFIHGPLNSTGLYDRFRGQLEDPNLTSFNNSIYAIWGEGGKVTIAKFNDDLARPSWTILNYTDPERPSLTSNYIYRASRGITSSHQLVSYNSKLYAVWAGLELLCRDYCSTKSMINLASNVDNPSEAAIDTFIHNNSDFDFIGADPVLSILEENLTLNYLDNLSNNHVRRRTARYTGNDTNPEWTFDEEPSDVPVVIVDEQTQAIINFCHDNTEDLGAVMMVSLYSDRSNASNLEGATLEENILFPFLQISGSISTIDFYVDRLPQGAPLQTEKNAPYDVGSGNLTTAQALNFTPGQHRIISKINFQNGSSKYFCTTFQVL